MDELNLIDGEPNEQWKQKMRRLNKEQIINLFQEELKQVKPLKDNYEKLKAEKSEMEEMISDPDRLGQYLAGL